MAGRVAAQTDRVDAVEDSAQPAHGPVRAAGGLVVRDGRVLLVHRPRFDDWSLPKGKLKRGEHPLAGAVREVHEETGVLGVPGARLPSARYEVWSRDALVAKLVDYWAMTVGSVDEFTPDDEVDEISWLPVAEALRILSYPRDVHVLRAFTELPPLSPPVVLVRAPDPTDPTTAATLASLLVLMRPGRLVDADAGRCRETLEPVARELSLEIEIDNRITARADTALPGLVNADAATVVCGGSELLAAVDTVLRDARSLSREARAEHRIVPGDALVLSFSGGALVAADPLSPRVA